MMLDSTIWKRAEYFATSIVLGDVLTSNTTNRVADVYFLKEIETSNVTWYLGPHNQLTKIASLKPSRTYLSFPMFEGNHVDHLNLSKNSLNSFKTVIILSL